MRTAITLAAIITLGIGHASDAHADGWFFSEGFGTSEVGGELGEHFDGTMNIRVAVGRRFRRFAIEGFVMGNMMDGKGALAGGLNEVTSYGLSARYMFPVGSHLELYLRGGLQNHVMTVESVGFGDAQFEGRGIHYGAGAQIKKKVPVVGLLFFPLFFTDIGPKMTGSLWLETSHQITRLHHPSYASVDGSFKSWTFGFGLGSDF